MTQETKSETLADPLKPVATAWTKNGVMVNAFPFPPGDPTEWDRYGDWAAKGYSREPLFSAAAVQQAAYLRERLGLAHDKSLDGDHRGNRDVLMSLIQELDAALQPARAGGASALTEVQAAMLVGLESREDAHTAWAIMQSHPATTMRGIDSPLNACMYRDECRALKSSAQLSLVASEPIESTGQRGSMADVFSALQPVRVAPPVPGAVIAAVQAYGDSRADDDGKSEARVAYCVALMREWASSLIAISAAALAALPDLVKRITIAYEQGVGHALRTELSNPYSVDPMERDAWDRGRKEGQRKSVVLPQTADEQEPVAWTVAGHVTNWDRDFSKYRTQHYVRPVYAAPVATARQPLTDEQIDAAMPWADYADLIETFNAVQVRAACRAVLALRGPAAPRPVGVTQVNLGPMLFKFDSFSGWVSGAQRAWKAAGVRSDDTVCVDSAGRICRIGRDFTRARDEGRFPVSVYLMREDMAQTYDIGQEGGAL